MTVADSLHSGVTLALNGVGTIGYYQVDTKGTVAHFGDAGFFGDLSGTTLNKPIVGIAQTGDDGGYWLVASDGGIFTFGDAGFFGGRRPVLNKPMVGMAPTRDGGGYWLVAADGGIFDYGDAPFYGSTGSMTLNKPIVGMAATRRGGYWLVASDGGIFAYGDAGSTARRGACPQQAHRGHGGRPPTAGATGWCRRRRPLRLRRRQFYGSTGNIRLAQPIVGMRPARRRGYSFSAALDGLFNYGTAPFFVPRPLRTSAPWPVRRPTGPRPCAFLDLSGDTAMR